MIIFFEATEVDQYYTDSTAGAQPWEVHGLSVGSSADIATEGDVILD